MNVEERAIRRKRIIALIAISLVSAASSCSSVSNRSSINTNSGGPASGVYRGFYISGFERSGFQPCGSDEVWWVIPPPEVASAMQARVPPAGNSNNEPRRLQGYSAYVEWRGEVSRQGRYGHLGAYAREIRPTELLDARSAPPEDCR